MGVTDTIFARWLSRADRRHSAPVVIANESRPRHFAEGGGIAVAAYLTNDSPSPGRNVRFGVELNGLRFGFRHPGDSEPSRINVVRPGERAPPEGAWLVVIPDDFNFTSGGDPDPGRVYWCWYQSPDGLWWETLNPAQRSADVQVRRRHLHRPRLAWERRTQQRALKKGRASFRAGQPVLVARLDDEDDEDD